MKIIIRILILLFFIFLSFIPLGILGGWQYAGAKMAEALPLFGEFMITYLILTAIIVIGQKKKIFWHLKRVFYAFLITFFIDAFLINIAAYRQPEILKFEASLYFGRIDSSTMAAAVYRRIVEELIMPAWILGIILLGVYVFSRMGPKYRKELINKQLIKASEKGDIKKVTLLLENGADVNTKDNDGWTPLMHAAEKGHKEVVELLIEKGADVNIQDEDGWTALMFASQNGHKEVVELLIEKGADVNAKDYFGLTALMFAEGMGHKEIVKLLKSYGAKE